MKSHLDLDTAINYIAETLGSSSGEVRKALFLFHRSRRSRGSPEPRPSSLIQTEVVEAPRCDYPFSRELSVVLTIDGRKPVIIGNIRRFDRRSAENVESIGVYAIREFDIESAGISSKARDAARMMEKNAGAKPAKATRRRKKSFSGR